MGAIDVLAVILSVIVLIKIGVIFLAGPKTWLKVPQFLLKHKEATVVVYSLGVLVSGYYLLTTLSVIEVMAAVLFGSLLLAMSLMPYYDALLKTAQKSMPDRKSVFKQHWMQLLFWILLAVITLYEVFTK